MNLKSESDLSFPEKRPGQNLLIEVEEFYFWLMRSCTLPQELSATFQALSQIMRIAQIATEGGDYISLTLENEALKTLSNIKERVNGGEISLHNLLNAIQDLLQKLTHENPKALLVAKATEIEYIFCINTSFQAPNIHYKETFKNYLKEVVQSILYSLSETQAKAIAQTMAQILESSESSKSDPKKALQDGISKAGILIITSLKEDPRTYTSQDSITG